MDSKKYAALIYDNMLNMFRNDEDSLSETKFDLNKIDATAFFTGAFMALCLLFNKLTKDEKNYLEMTYIFNQLIVQHMKEKEE